VDSAHQFPCAERQRDGDVSRDSTKLLDGLQDIDEVWPAARDLVEPLAPRAPSSPRLVKMATARGTAGRID